MYILFFLIILFFENLSQFLLWPDVYFLYVECKLQFAKTFDTADNTYVIFDARGERREYKNSFAISFSTVKW